MSWTYRQSDGQLTAANGFKHGCGYSGKGDGVNNPAWQSMPFMGPIPVGSYTIQPPVTTDKHGPYVLWLTPDPANEMFGRDEFGIHGDKVGEVGQFLASKGCIILPRVTREIIWNSGDHSIKVVP